MYRIVEENEEFVLIDKLPGFSVHKDQEDTGLTMQLKADRGYDELMPVHRLDKVTSGLMLFARNHAAASELSRAFSEHLVEKYYLALSDRKPKKKQGAIIGDMTRARRGAWRSGENPDQARRYPVFQCVFEAGHPVVFAKAPDWQNSPDPRCTEKHRCSHYW